MKIGLIIALIGPFAGFFGMWYVCCALSHQGYGVTLMDEAAALSLFVGAPLGLITFRVLGLWIGFLLEHKAIAKVAAWVEELEEIAERGGIVKVRVELTSYVDHDAIRGDLEKAGFLEIDERTLFEKLFSSGSVKWVTGTINAARIKELAALSFVKSVEIKGSMGGRGG